MRYLTGFFIALLFSSAAIASTGEGYKVEIDLTRVVSDKIRVKMFVPEIKEDVVEFQMPKIVPGTYSISDFGRFVSSFKAIGKDNKTLPIRRIDKNRWEIQEASNLDFLSYWVADTFDSKKDNKIFEPGGTNIEEGKNYTINPFGMIGYIKDYNKVPFEVEFTHADNHFGVSAMKKEKRAENKDVFFAPDYFELSDAPVMYCEADTATIPVGNCTVTISVYSPNDVLNAAAVKEAISSTLDAQRKYLGGTLPVSNYAVLIYLFENQSNSGASGALEHSTSTLLCLPEAPIEALEQTFKDVTAHEFFHIVTPLNIHSEHIHDYDFINPQMSKHLWLYEGVTEYSAHHAQVRDAQISDNQFLNVLRGKMNTADFYNQDVSFTDMSMGALDKYESQYGNVYQKGALIGMCVDLILLQESKGEYNLQNLMKDLAKNYGKHQAFEDEKLFSIIESMTYPSVGEFLRKHVGGTEALPFTEVLGYAGVDYQAEKEIRDLSLGQVGTKWNENGFKIDYALNPSELYKSLGLKVGDIITGVNDFVFEKGIPIDEQLTTSFSDLENGSKYKMMIISAEKGKAKKLKGKVGAGTTKKVKHYLSFKESISDEQKKVREAWLKN